MAFSMAMGWSEGESKMHSLLHLPPQDNPTSTMLTAQASFMLQRAPLLAIGTLDDESRPWTALWGGAPGFSEPIGGGFVGTRTLVDSKYDPVVQALVGGAGDGEMLQPQSDGKMLSGLAIDLVTRKRVKIAGKMVAGTMRSVDIEVDDNTILPLDAPKTQAQIQLVSKIEQSLGNCPKYLNQYSLSPVLLTPTLLSSGPALSLEARTLIDRADMFFLSTTSGTDMDTNHRGGPPGFVRTISPTCIVYPEYSGNRLYQSLGNLQINPLIGVTIPDYETGAVLYTTGVAQILVGDEASKTLPGSNLVVKINLTETKHIAQGLAFRGTLQLNGHSPYNPRPRPLASERTINPPLSPSPTRPTARLVQKTLLTPTIARFTFKVPGGLAYTPSQWILLSFKPHLDLGYSHMRASDPRSLNDDYTRTFTISSAPSSSSSSQTAAKRDDDDDVFEITIRSVGRVTEFLFQQDDARAGLGLELQVPVLGIGGGFEVAQREGERVCFVAGGVGVTPLLGQVAGLDVRPERFRLLWAVRGVDVGLVGDVLERDPRLAGAMRVFVTGVVGESEMRDWGRIRSAGVAVEFRRLVEGDVDALGADTTWYVCAARALREQVLEWLPGRDVVFEDFGY